MTAARLLLDEMLSPRIAEQLEARGHDVVSVVAHADLLQLPDEDVLAYGASEQRIVVTLNIGDFALLDAQWRSQGRSHAGLVYLSTATFPQDRGFLGAVVEALDVAARQGLLPGPEGSAFLARH